MLFKVQQSQALSILKMVLLYDQNIRIYDQKFKNAKWLSQKNKWDI